MTHPDRRFRSRRGGSSAPLRRRRTRRRSSARCGRRGWPSTSARPRRASSSRSSSARRGSAARRWTTCCCSARRGSARRRSRHIIANELGVNLRQTSGPVLEKPKDLAAILTNLERNDVLFIDEIHRLIAGRRGDPLPGARGLPDRHHDRRGPGGALDQARPAAVHADRRDDARRHADQPAARPLRHRRAARVLHARGAGADRPPLGRPARGADRRRRRMRDRAPLARHAAHRQPPAAPRARLRRREGRRPRSTSRSPTRRWRCSTSTRTAST